MTREKAPPRRSYDPRLWYALFVQLGASRTLKGVRDYARELGIEKVPALNSLERWSAKFKWMEEAQKFEARVAERTIEITGETDAQRDARHRVGLRTMYSVAVHHVVTKEKAIADGVSIEEVTAPQAGTMLNSTIDAERLVTGAATSRIEIAHTFMEEFAPHIANLFVSINMIADSSMRAQQFAEGMNDLARRYTTEVASSA